MEGNRQKKKVQKKEEDDAVEWNCTISTGVVTLLPVPVFICLLSRGLVALHRGWHLQPPDVEIVSCSVPFGPIDWCSLVANISGARQWDGERAAARWRCEAGQGRKNWNGFFFCFALAPRAYVDWRQFELIRNFSSTRTNSSCSYHCVV